MADSHLLKQMQPIYEDQVYEIRRDLELELRFELNYQNRAYATFGNV